MHIMLLTFFTCSKMMCVSIWLGQNIKRCAHRFIYFNPVWHCQQSYCRGSCANRCSSVKKGFSETVKQIKVTFCTKQVVVLNIQTICSFSNFWLGMKMWKRYSYHSFYASVMWRVKYCQCVYWLVRKILKIFKFFSKWSYGEEFQYTTAALIDYLIVALFHQNI